MVSDKMKVGDCSARANSGRKILYMGGDAEIQSLLLELDSGHDYPPGLGMNRIWTCGYVRIPKGHAWFDTPYEKLSDLFAEPGYNEPTYGEMKNPWTGKDDGGWWVGYDNNHYNQGPQDQTVAVNEPVLVAAVQCVKDNGLGQHE